LIISIIIILSPLKIKNKIILKINKKKEGEAKKALLAPF
jgi:hypothetical protein